MATTYPRACNTTVIDRNLAEIGRTAADLLLERMGEGEGAERPAVKIAFPTHLVLGLWSCARPMQK